MNENKLMSLLNHSRQVMQVSEKIKVKQNLGKNAFAEGNNDPWGIPSDVLGKMETSTPTTFTNEQFEQSKLPKEILESMKVNPNLPQSKTSVLDSIPTPPKITVVRKQNKNPLVENTSASSSIDYSLIKMIVEDCMKKYTSSIKKSLLTENKQSNDSLSLITLKDKKLKLVDNKGNVYEAELKYKGNINKK